MISVYDFFSGCGGASSGFQATGLTIQLGLDLDSDSAKSFQGHFPSASFIQKDLRKVKLSEVEGYMNYGHRSLFCGCAPCQPFSVMNRKVSNKDDRILLLAEMCRFIKHFRPDYIFI
jgi:DNA (cytosine-5)-methyltransferase 1